MGLKTALNNISRKKNWLKDFCYTSEGLNEIRIKQDDVPFQGQIY